MAGIKWKDTRIAPSDWPKVKPEIESQALGSLPILKLNGQVFYQTEAIIEWAASKAGIISDCPVRRMKVSYQSSKVAKISRFQQLIVTFSGENDSGNTQRSW